MKDKAFELELSWVGEGSDQSQPCPGAQHPVVIVTTPTLLSAPFTVTNGRHTLVPKDVREEAEKYAKVRQGDADRRGRRQTDRQVTSGVSLFQDSLEEEDDSDEDNM